MMPWQREFADVAGEINPETGRPAYRDVIVSVPRQSGKTMLMLAAAIDACLDPERDDFRVVGWSAQSGKDARDKWIDEVFPKLHRSAFAKRCRTMSGFGNERIEFKDAGVIRLVSGGEGSGHSKTLDMALLDELWHDVDERREQALRPAMATKPAAQMWSVSTMGTQASVPWNRKVELGRRAVEDDRGVGACYVEYSCDPERWPLVFDHPEVLAEYHPAVGFTQTIDTLHSDILTTDPDEARRAYGNITSDGAHGDRVWPAEVWAAVCAPGFDPVDPPLVFGVDALPDLSAASVAVANGSGARLLERGLSMGETVARCRELVGRWGGRVAWDAGGPWSSQADELVDDPAVDVVPVASRGVADGCGRLFSRVADGSVRFRSDPRLDEAVEGLVKKPVGDRFVWDRRRSRGDVTPVMAATIALHVAEDAPQWHGPLVALR